jgi:O-antigen/teichoic acid export membrane protein
MLHRLTRAFEQLRGGGIGAILARGASAFLVIQLLGLAISFGVQVLLARSMGTESYGTYVYVVSWMAVLLLLCRAGFGTASLRFVAAFVALRDWARLRGYLRTSQVVVGAASLVVAAATALVAWGLGERAPAPTRATLLVASLALPIHAFLQLWSHVLRALQRVIACQLPGNVLQPALLALGAGALVVARPGTLEAPLAMALNLGSASAAALVTLVLLRRAVPAETRSVRAAGEPREWMRVAAPLLLVNALLAVQERTDVLVVGSLLGPSQAGIYGAASRIASLIAFGLVAVNAWAAPLISDLYARGDRAGLQRLVRLAARGIFALTFPVCVALAFFGRQVLAMFGPEFVDAHVALLVLAASQLVNALTGPVGFLMTMTGRQTAAARILALHSVLVVVLSFVLVPRHGIVGAALAAGATRASWNIVMAITVWRTMRLRATIF